MPCHAMCQNKSNFPFIFQQVLHFDIYVPYSTTIQMVFLLISTTFEVSTHAVQPLLLYLIIYVLVAVVSHKIAQQILKTK